MESRNGEIIQWFLFKASASVAFAIDTACSGPWLMIVQNLQRSLYSEIIVSLWVQLYFNVDKLSRLYKDEGSNVLFIEYLIQIADSLNYPQMVPILTQMCN